MKDGCLRAGLALHFVNLLENRAHLYRDFPVWVFHTSLPGSEEPEGAGASIGSASVLAGPKGTGGCSSLDSSTEGPGYWCMEAGSGVGSVKVSSGISWELLRGSLLQLSVDVDDEETFASLSSKSWPSGVNHLPKSISESMGKERNVWLFRPS